MIFINRILLRLENDYRLFKKNDVKNYVFTYDLDLSKLEFFINVNIYWLLKNHRIIGSLFFNTFHSMLESHFLVIHLKKVLCLTMKLLLSHRGKSFFTIHRRLLTTFRKLDMIEHHFVSSEKKNNCSYFLGETNFQSIETC